MKLLVTGGCGFIGSNFIRLVLNETEHKIINLDALTYAGNPENLKDIEKKSRYKFVKGRIQDPSVVEKILNDGVDAIINFAAESHVDRSILEPESFISTNIIGTAVLLQGALKFKQGLKLFLQVSTDEVYGEVLSGLADENYPLRASSPYSASKASADLLCLSYHRTYNLPVTIVRCSNNFGPYQFPEKLIPLFITNALEDKPLPIYGDGKQIRDWIFVEDCCRGILLVLEEGKKGDVYNIGGGNLKTNLEVTELILKELKKPKRLIKFVEDRPGHDRRYALDSKKISTLGFKPGLSFEEGIRLTVKWYLENRGWWQRVKSGEYRDYYKKQYGKRLKT